MEEYILVPRYRKGFMARIARPFYDLFIGNRGVYNSLYIIWSFAIPLSLTNAFMGNFITGYMVLMGWVPSLYSYQNFSHFPYVFWGLATLGFLFGLMIPVSIAGESYRQTHEEHFFRRINLALSGILGILWSLGLATGRYDDFRGFGIGFFTNPWYVYPVLVFSVLRLVVALVWVFAVRYERVSAVEATQKDNLPDVGVVIKGDNRNRSDALPKPGEKEAIIWQIRREVVLPPQVEEEVANAIILLRHYKAYEKHFGKEVPRGVLLQGPPGTGKTTVARFIAKHGGLSFVTAPPEELRSKWLGESARLVAKLFQKARSVAPAVLFIDELEGVVPRRGGHDETNHLAGQFLQELDGLKADMAKAPIFFIGATNQPHLIDPALLSRIGLILTVPLPGHPERKRILEILLKDKAEGVDLDSLASLTEGFSGRDLHTVLQRASRKAFTEGRTKVNMDDLREQILIMVHSAFGRI